MEVGVGTEENNYWSVYDADVRERKRGRERGDDADGDEKSGVDEEIQNL